MVQDIKNGQIPVKHSTNQKRLNTIKALNNSTIYKTKRALPYVVAISVFKILFAGYGIVLLIRYLDGAKYGVLVLLMALPNMFNMLLAFGSDHYIMRYFPSIDNKKQISNILWNIVARRMLLAAIVCLILSVTFNLYAKRFGLAGYYKEFLVFQFVVIANLSIICFSAAFNALHKQDGDLYSNVISQIVSVSLITYGVTTKQLFLYFVLSIAVTQIVQLICSGALFLYWYGIPDIIKMIGKRNENSEEKAYRRISYVNEIGTNFLQTDIDRYILAFFSTSIEVAIYACATQFLSYIGRLSPTSLIRGIIKPTIFSRYDETKSESDLNQALSLIMCLNIQYLGLVAVILIPMGKEILHIFLKQDYAVSAYTPMLVFFSLSFYDGYNPGYVAQAIKKPKILLIAKVSALLNVALAIPLAHFYGAIGMACATTCCAFTQQLIIYCLCIKYVKMPLPIKQILRSLTNVSVAVLVAYTMKFYLPKSLFAPISMATLTFILMSRINIIFKPNDINIIMTLMPTKLSAIIRKVCYL